MNPNTTFNLNDGEIITVNNVPINGKLLNCLQHLSSQDRASRVIKTISDDLLYCQKVQTGEPMVTELLSETTIAFNADLMEILVVLDELQSVAEK